MNTKSGDYPATGLSSKEVEERIRENKINGNFQIKTKSIGQILFTNVFTLFNIVNLILAAFVIYVQSYRNVLFMMVVFWNLFIGVFQEIRSKKIIDRLSLLSAPEATVIRNGKKETIPLEDIVLDDLMILSNGNEVCADAIIIDGSCEVNESMLTGENIPIHKHPGDELLSGSFLVSGHVKASVTHIGKDNYVNQITSKAKYIRKNNSEMLSSIKMIIKIVSICLFPITALLFYNQLHMPGVDFTQAVVSTVAAVIGMIPSGLVLLISMVLAVSVIKLSKKNTLVQELYCIENLSKVDVLCLDKTGTLTEGKMNLEDIVPFDESDFSTYDIKKALYQFSHTLEDNNSTFIAVKERSEEFFRPEESDKLSSPAAVRSMMSSSSLPKTWEVHQLLAFSSERKWSMVDFKDKGCFVMGATEFVFPSMSDELRKKADMFTRKGMRVLVFAHSKEHSKDGQTLPEHLHPIAFLLLTDKLREDAEETLAYFAKQGVTIKIISGDNPAAVSYIAGRAGLKNADRYVDASTLINDEELEVAAEHYQIFGRVTPDQKLKLVKALQKHGHTVAMTGDGVNDVLALKEADCSIAMQSGSDAARNVAQIVLLDSSFSSMPAIVAEGRQTINNVQRSAALYLTKTIYSTILACFFVFLNEPYPFVPIQTTLTGALTIGIPSFILALEPNRNRVRGKFLKNILCLAIPGGLVVVISVFATEIFGNIFMLSNASISTLATYALFIASSVELFKVCLPFNPLRRTLFGFLIGVFVIASTFFADFFSFTPLLRWQNILFVAVLVPACMILYYLLDFLVEHFMGSTPNVYRVYPGTSDELLGVLVTDEVESKDYVDVTRLMTGYKHLDIQNVHFMHEAERGGDISIESCTEAAENCFDLDGIAIAAGFVAKMVRKNNSHYFESNSPLEKMTEKVKRRELKKMKKATKHLAAKSKKIIVYIESPYYEFPIKVITADHGQTAMIELPENEFYPDLPPAGTYLKKVKLYHKRKLTF